MKWYLILMCLLLPWKTGFFVKAITNLLSHAILVAEVYSIFRSSKTPLNHKAWHPAMERAIYSASADDNATFFCFFDCHDIAPEPRVKTYPVVLLLSSRLLPKSLSQNPFRCFKCKARLKNKHQIESTSKGCRCNCICYLSRFSRHVEEGEQMDLLHDRASMIAEEEDRISKLPDDIIHRILSFLDMKYAIQTSTLSKKWKHIWTSMPYLNLNSETFPTLPRFSNFVKHALSHRNHSTDVSAVELAFTSVVECAFTGEANQSVVKNIVKYAYSRNVRQLAIIWSKISRKFHEFPQYFFSSHTLKHLTLETREDYFHGRRVPISAWDFPALETLYLSDVILGDDGDKNLDLFSKCVNLKDLTLHQCFMFDCDIFHVCAPHLSNLTITGFDCFPRVFNVVAPQLQNLTAQVNGLNYFDGFNFLQVVHRGLGFS